MIKKDKFFEDDFIIFNDYDNIMIQAFNIGCSLCGIETIEYAYKDIPQPIGNKVKEIHDNNPNVSDVEIEELLKDLIDDWQNYDDKNASEGIPTFLCSECYFQLLKNEISVSKTE
ncbi:hypothetical protein [Spiroplasma turonicum]|uniref:Uncharacterized protein n=1 Tax=Spiroplasma turonicum TaxID=216946 RepID=A0A0K1P702_9MOLU|nr:hypothetical protein [Spiroplasma turonicum]AKU80055.1 hypothetical protein STURON_00809 [Spiroplasma turonicum]ALX71057.1 hypothetical protein STURO_v1c08060 [Spiroplasma turonicum]